MSVLRIPTRIKFFPNFMKDYFSRKSVISAYQSNNNAVIRLCFFSCESYFSYLYCACHSLKDVLHDIDFKVFIFSDNEMPLTEKQINALKDLIPQTEVLSWPKSMGWGKEQISNIWKAYSYVAKTASPQDIIARVDSDVFFFNDRIFKYVLASDADLIGDGHFVEFKYVQGGCYFFKASAVTHISNNIDKYGIEFMLKDCPIEVEDVAADYMAKKLQLRVNQTWFMAFPQEIINAGGIKRWIHFKFSCAHFVMKNKDKMLDAYRDYVVTKPEYNSMLEEINKANEPL